MKVLKLTIVMVFVCALLCSCSALSGYEATDRNGFFAGDGAYLVGNGGQFVAGEDVYVYNDGEGGMVVINPDNVGGVVVKTENNENDENDENNNDSTYALDATLYYFHYLTSYGSSEDGRVVTLDLKSDNTFSYGSMYYVHELTYDSGWYCPGGETSGVDTPYWEGTYTWDGTNLSLNFVDRVITIYSDEALVPTGVRRDPVNKTVNMSLVSETTDCLAFNSEPLPLESPFKTVEVGQIKLFNQQNLCFVK